MTIGTALTLVQPQAVWALEPTEVNAIAEEITVWSAGGGSNGTGVIIAKICNTYYVAFDSCTGFRLPNRAIRSPDAAWVRKELWLALTPLQRKKYVPLCPDF